MATTTITLDTGHEARVTRGSFTPYGTHYSSIMFAPDSADVVATTDSTIYMDYCANEVAYLELARLAELAGIDTSGLWEDLWAQGITCDCDDDDDEGL